MKKKLSFELRHNEFLEIAGIDRVDFDHERNAPTETGIKAVVRGYIKGGKSLTKADVTSLTFARMYDKGFIEDSKGWRISVIPHHRWSVPNDEGNRHSVYTIEVSIYQYDEINIRDSEGNLVW